jgi:predicted ATPase/DNA-binding XRE family transcriptional regulator
MQRSTSFGRILRMRRKALDLTQAALAQQVGCAEITIRKIEADEIRPSRQFLARLADQLGIAASEQAGFVAAGRGTLSERINNLPTPPNALIGREAELTAVRARFQADGVRLLTLTGPGGAGKTRLALQIAQELADTFDDGVCFVPLAALADPELVGPAIVRALALDDQGSAPPIEQLKQFLRDRSLLLLLDNFEQIGAAAPLVAALLAHCPNLRMLVTSRVPLHLSGEHEFAVPPLALPAPRAALSDESCVYPAIALFVARARAVRADFILTHETAPAIAQICARLDGLPLAIELAAAWIKLLTPEALLARLSGAQPLHMLAGGPRDLPARQQTLRNTIAWSYALLAPAEQQLFRALGVCIGGCTLEAAEALAGDRLPGQAELLAALAALVDGSLLRRETDRAGAVRVAMLETIREYALELLADSGELSDQQQRHARTFLALAQAARPHLQDRQLEVWLERLAADHDNLHTALAWSCSPMGDATLGLQLAEALWEFWLVRGHISEGRAWIAALLDRPAARAPSVTQARLLGGAGRLAWAQNDWQQAARLLEQSQALCAELGDVAGSAGALNHLGEVAEAQGNYPHAAAFFARSLALFEQLGDREGSASALVSYAQMMQAQGQHERAAELVAASLTLFEELGDRRGLAVALTVQGQVMYMLGEYARADALFDRSLEVFHSLGYRHGAGWALTNQGQTALAQGDYRRAEERFAESLELYTELGDGRGQAWAMTNQGQAAHAQGDTTRGVALLERGVALFDALGDQRGYAWALYYSARAMNASHHNVRIVERFVESLRIFHTLGDARFSADCLNDLAKICAGLGHRRTAVQLFAAADTQRRRSSASSPASGEPVALAALRCGLGETTFAAAWEAGSALAAEQAIALVRQAMEQPLHD